MNLLTSSFNCLGKKSLEVKNNGLEQFFNNPGLSHIGENILHQVGLDNIYYLESCSGVCQAWEVILENPRFWLSFCIKNTVHTLDSQIDVLDVYL